MNNPTEKDRLAILNLEDALVEDVLAMSDEELMANSREIGMDVEQEAMHMRQLLERTAGKARMAAAKAEMAEYVHVGHHMPEALVPGPPMICKRQG